MDDSATINNLLAARILVIQIIRGALIAGVVMLVVMLQNRLGNAAPAAAADAAPRSTMLSYAAVGFFAVVALAWAVMPSQLSDKAVSTIANSGSSSIAAASSPPASGLNADTVKLLDAYQTKSIIAGALFEASAFFATVAFMTEGQYLALGIAAAALLMMALTFPTGGRVRGWLQDQQIRVDEVRQFGDGA